MHDSAFDPPELPRGFWVRSDVRSALENRDIGRLFRLLAQYGGLSQTRIGTATGLSQNRVSLITRSRQAVTSLALITRIADGLAMPDAARHQLGIASASPRTAPARPVAGGDQSAELLRRIATARYLDDSVIAVLQHETDTLRLLDRQLGAPAAAAKLAAHVSQLADSLHHCLSPDRRHRLALVLADAAALAGWQAIDMGRLPQAWDRFEVATAAAREADDDSLLAFAAGEQAYVLLDLGQPGQALDKVRAVREHHAGSLPRQLRCWLFAAEAEMAAAVGSTDDCRLALDLAHDQISHTAAADADLPYLALNETHLARWRGNCLVRFGDTTTISDLTTALAGMDGTFNRAEAGLRCDLATVMHAAGERHEARRHLHRASELAQLTGSARQRRRIADLTRRIGTAA